MPASFLATWLLATWDILVASSPSLLLGFFLAGVIHVVFRASNLGEHLKTPGFRSVLRATLIGVPLPLCSCSVIPTGLSLRKNGASAGATASFFISTPEIGVDSFILSYTLLGPYLALTRVVAALSSSLAVGLAIDTWPGKKSMQTEPSQSAACCHSEKNEVRTKQQSTPNVDRVEDSIQTRQTKAQIIVWSKAVFHYGFVQILDDMSPLFVVGILSAALIGVVIPSELFLSLNANPILVMLAMLFISLPLYVCATASTPLAATLIAKGLNPGAVIVMLLAGPATNVTTMLAIKKELGKRALAIYISGIAILSLVFGILTNTLVEFFPSLLQQLISGMTHEHMQHSFVSTGLAFVVAVLLILSLVRKTKL